MAQHDFNIANATFPSVRSDINSVLTAINTTQSGTSTPASAVAGTIWLDTTSATTPTLKYYDGADNISLATIDHVGNTVNWLDSTVSITGLSTTATATVLTLSDSANTTTVNLIIDNQKEVRFRETTANGTNYIGLKAPASVSADLTFTLPVAPTANNQALVATTAGVMSFTPYAFPSADGTANQVIQTNGSGILSFATINAGTPTIDEYTTGTAATYTKPASANWILVEIFAGGGSGGNGSAGGAGSGGGGGAYNYFMTPFANLVGDVTYTVGAGGASATVTNTSGNVGGTTTVNFANFDGSGLTKTLSVFGGGGGGGANGAGGGGIFGAGSITQGGSPSQLLASTETIFNPFGGTNGAIGSTGTVETSIYGGSGGGGGNFTTGAGGLGGNSIYGGAGGGGASDQGTTGGTGGTSQFGGNGGNGGLNGGAPTAGSAGGGGGGGSEARASGAGGSGLVRFTYW